MYEATLAFCIIAIILVFVNLVSAGFAGVKFNYIVGAGHLLCIFIATLLCCLSSFEACNLCAGFAGGTCFANMAGILIWHKKREMYYEHHLIRLWSWIFIIADFACSMICYFSVYNFLEVGIWGLIGLGIGVVVAFINKNYEKHIFILNIFFCVYSAVFACVGFIMYAEYNKDITVEISCGVYTFDNESSEAGDRVSGNLNEGEYYAVQFSFEWGNLKSLANSSEDIRISVYFPDVYPYAVEGYISEGRAFTCLSNEGKTTWLYTFTANLRTDKEFTSGYFIVNYDNLVDLTESGATEIEIPFEVMVHRQSGDELVLLERSEFVYTFLKN